MNRRWTQMNADDIRWLLVRFSCRNYWESLSVIWRLLV